MKKRFFGKDPEPKEETEKKEEKGVIIPAIFPSNISDLAKRAKRAGDLIGKNTEFVNLRDHPELDGTDILILGLEGNTGEFGYFVKIYAVKLDDNQNPIDKIIIMTGAENVIERCLAMAENGHDFQKDPVIATLRAAGDAWLLD